jgi:hypothetical protein
MKETRGKLKEYNTFVWRVVGRDVHRFEYEPWQELIERYGSPDEDDGVDIPDTSGSGMVERASTASRKMSGKEPEMAS